MKFDCRLVLALVCAAGMACACGSDGNDNNNGGDGVENTSDLCSDNLDNDGNNLKDCSDPGCKDFAFCQKTEEGKENTLAACMDDEDNDGDGLKNCDDPDCKAFAICQEGEDENTPEKGKDSKDNDKDGFIDCDDSDCKAFNFCANSGEQNKTENSPNDCLDGEDNDGDGKYDCCDEGCKVFAFCANQCAEDAPAPTESTLDECTDGDDNDKNGKIDCLDPSCHVHDICKELVGVAENTRELCSDNVDNDYNGVSDKDDPNCKLFYAAGGQYGENDDAKCKDKQDNDGDGVMDCDDPECQVYDFCQAGYKESDDECPGDPFTFKKLGSCACGQTLIGTECYTNIVTAEDFDKMADSSGKFILKQNVDFGTVNAPDDATTFSGIANFTGTFDGGNKRIAGVFNQKGSDCGLFAGNRGEREFRNIDIAITLNCDATSTTGKNTTMSAGALTGTFSGKASNITGSSKVYVEEKTLTETYTLPNAVSRNVGGLFGFVGKADISDIHIQGNVSGYFPNSKIKADGKQYIIAVGGIAGRIYGKTNGDGTLVELGTIQNVTANTFVTVVRNRLYENDWGYASVYLGGIAGYSVAPAENIHNQGVVSYYATRATSTSAGYWARSVVGGLFGRIDKIRDSSFSGRIETNSEKIDSQSAGAASTDKVDYGTKVGGIAGWLRSLEGNYIDHCTADAELRVVAQGSEIGGIVGRLAAETASTYVRNSSANIDLYLLNALGDYIDSGYYGGIVGRSTYENNIFSGKTGYIVNNSARTRYHVTASTLPSSMVKFFYGISGSEGIVVNNFASDEIVCDGDCGDASYSTRAIGGSYVYESYWNRDTVGWESGASEYTDASAEPYTYNILGIPVTRANNTVLGLLRYNSGHDGGVISAHIPTGEDVKYYNWTTVNDKDGHEILVPADE